LLTKVAQSSEL